MVLSVEEALKSLNLKEGATQVDITNSFKTLALKWHPDKHSGSDKSFQQFSIICDAYRRLTTRDDKIISKPLTKDKMFEMFQEVYLNSSVFSQQNGNDSEISSDDSDYDNELILQSLSNKVQNRKDLYQDKKTEEPDRKISEEDARINADRLVADEEKERKKAEKRRARKKRRKQKKKLEKENKDGNNTTSTQQGKNKPANKSSSEVESDSEEELDRNSAFVHEAVGKNKKVNINNVRTPKVEKSGPKDAKEASDKNAEKANEIDPTILHSRNLAMRGNQMAGVENFLAASELFSEAIKMNPQDFRFYGNRSFCYDKLGQYEKALKDADKAIQINPEWPKNYHRRGRALAGLKKYLEAEAAFEQVLRLDKNCEDAQQELFRVKMEQIIDMGFTRQQAEQALKWHGNVQAAIDALLSGGYAGAISAQRPVASEVYISDDESHIPSYTSPRFANSVSASQHHHQPYDIKMDPRNLEGYTSLWVGNISKEVKENQLKYLFSKYGTVFLVRLMPEKFCAFVNYVDNEAGKESASKAMKALQSVMFGGQNLLIRYPEKKSSYKLTNELPNLLLRKNTNKTTVQQRVH